MMEVSVDVYINTQKLEQQFKSLLDDECMWQIHDLFAKMCSPYVPMQTGILADKSVRIYKDKAAWEQPYARYQYMGELYLAPNGSAWAHYGEKKYPTGIPLNYNHELHGKASKEWDKAMMSEQGEEFLAAVADILLKRCKKLYG